MEGLGGMLVSKGLGDQSQGFRCKKRGRDDSRPVWWKYQSGMDWQIGDTQEQEQGRLGEENVEKEQVVLCIALGQTVKGNEGWDRF